MFVGACIRSLRQSTIHKWLRDAYACTFSHRHVFQQCSLVHLFHGKMVCWVMSNNSRDRMTSKGSKDFWTSSTSHGELTVRWERSCFSLKWGVVTFLPFNLTEPECFWITNIVLDEHSGNVWNIRKKSLGQESIQQSVIRFCVVKSFFLQHKSVYKWKLLKSHHY